MTKKVWVMLDLETLGTKADSTIFQVAAQAFDLTTGVVHAEFNNKANIGLNETMNVDGSTLQWWLKTNKELLADLLVTDSNLSSKCLLELFNNWLLDLINAHGKENVCLFGNGCLFDNAMVKSQLEAIGVPYPIHYRNDRDVRTLVDMASTKLGISNREFMARYKEPTDVAHDAMSDVKYQIRYVCGAYQELMGN